MSAAATIGEWNGDTFRAADGRVFALFSEQVRGERRYWTAKEQLPKGGWVEWRPIPGDGSYDRRTQRRRVERYARETLSEG